MRLRRISALFAMLVVATTLFVAATGPAPARNNDEVRRDEVRRAVDAGEVRSLADILDAVRGKLPGVVVGVEIERKNGNWLYEFRVVGGQGRIFDVHIDARTGKIERIKEK